LTTPSSTKSRADTGTERGLKEITVLDTDADLAVVMKRFMQGQRVAGRKVEILEAGCGNRWFVELDGLDYRLTGVDLDAAAIKIRKEKWRDLDEAVIGDLRTVDLGERKFDIIYNAYVLEHIDGAEEVLKRFVGWLKPNGIIVLRIPDAQSVYGLITRTTPHWFHVFYYRYILGFKSAGKPGYAPYPTYYDAVVSRAGLHAFAQCNSLKVEAEFGLGHDRLKLFKRIVNLLSFGRYADKHTNLFYVLRTGA